MSFYLNQASPTVNCRSVIPHKSNDFIIVYNYKDLLEVYEKYDNIIGHFKRLDKLYSTCLDHECKCNKELTVYPNYNPIVVYTKFFFCFPSLCLLQLGSTNEKPRWNSCLAYEKSFWWS